MEHLKGKINELEANNKKKNIRDLYRGINEFKKYFQPRINIINDDNVNLIADTKNILYNWKNFFNHVLNVQAVYDIRQMDIQRAEPLVPEPILVNVEIVIGKMISYKSPGTDNIPAEFVKAGGKTYSEMHRIILFYLE
jgi:hypothetical protein